MSSPRVMPSSPARSATPPRSALRRPASAVLALLLGLALVAPAGAAEAVPTTAAAATVATTAAPASRTTVLRTPAQCRRVFHRVSRQKACVKRWRTARAAAVSTPSRLKVGVAFGNTLPWMTAARRARALDDVVALGARSVRMDVPWSALQPQGPDSWSWAPFDTAVSAARARGLDVLPILTYTPRWAQDPSCTAGEFCPAADPQQFAAYAAAVVRRYAPLGVTTYEVWNEPNLSIFWPDPDPQRYRELLLPTTAAIKDAAPGARVLFGGLAHQASGGGRLSPADFVREACRAGGCEALAGISVHPYSFPMLASDTTTWLTPWEHLFRDGSGTQALVTVLDSLGLGALTLEVTEFGAPTGGQKLAASSGRTWVDGVTDHVTESLQATIVADGVRTAAKQRRIGSLYVYTDRDGGVNADPLDRGATFGLRRADGSAKPAWKAFRDAVAAIRR